MWRWFTEAAWAAGQIPRPKVAVKWSPPKFEAVDPQKEAPQVERPDPSRLEQWKAPTLLGSCVNLTNGTWAPVGYRRLPDGRVELRGAVQDDLVATTSGGGLFELPVDLRPEKVRGFAVYSEDPSGAVIGQCLVHSDGYVYAWLGANTKFVLDGIAFDPRETA